MPVGYTKEDIQFHSIVPFRPLVPAVNVKDYSYVSVSTVAEAVGCTEQSAADAIDKTYERAREYFWEILVDELVDMHLVPYFGDRAEGYSAGRSSGWVVVDGIGDSIDVLEGWDALALTAWYAFEKAVKGAVRGLTSTEYFIETIRENGWCEGEVMIIDAC